MKILLAAINAKYIHSNLAVYSLRAYAAGERPEFRGELEIAEYTINQPLDDILRDLYRQGADVYCFSCYLWNIEYVEQLTRELHKVLPQAEIWLGGPEASYHGEEMLKGHPQLRGIMCGEGEETFLKLVEYYHKERKTLAEIDGLVYRAVEESAESKTSEGTENTGETKTAEGTEESAAAKTLEGERKTVETAGIYTTAPAKVMDLSKVPFVYEDLHLFCNKIIYYESSRGCPFSCSYCLSSIDKCLRFRDLELVKKELKFFIDHEIPQVKFVDRTFNCKHEHAMAIWSYIKEQDKGKTNFHFEVAADLLNEAELDLIESMRPGLIQLEIGVQSTNERTIEEIRRTMKFSKVAEVVNRIHRAGNIHQHLDLIAGLPYEDYDSFHKSFCDVYALHPEQLQLGFLKVLKGSHMEEKTADYELLYQSRPPYEVLSTKWLSYSDVIRLKGVEEMVEVYYNSRQFEHTIELLETIFSDTFVMFEALRDYYEVHGLFGVSHTRLARYEILLAFAEQKAPEKREAFREMLVLDLYLRENVKNRPAFAGEETVSKAEAAEFYDVEAKERRYLKGYEGCDKRQLRKMTHLERVKTELLLFDYKNRSPLTNQAAVYRV